MYPAFKTKKNFISLLISALVIVCFGSITSCRKVDSISNSVHSSTPSYAQASSKPNIILVLGDDVGYEIPTVDGGESYQTPNMDMMAAEGMRFNQMRASPLCSPSRFMLLTGKYNFRNYDKWGIMDTSNRTIANMLQDAGYATCVSGKWQLSGGDVAIHALGFQDYMVWGPYTSEGGSESGFATSLTGINGKGSRYKNPEIYTDSAYLPSSVTRGKYGDDFFTQFVLDFIDSNVAAKKPFFAYYPMCLVHPPFSPTPLDPEFATWKSPTSDTAFFPSMVYYMDLKLGEIINHVKSLGIGSNTVIIYLGDNGTSGDITSIFNGQPYPGGKSHTKENGTRVPLFVWWQGKVAAGSINNDLVDLTDFMPTLAGIANTPVPTTYGVLDGVSFAPRLTGLPGTPRAWTFCHYAPNLIKHPNTIKRWVQDSTYKLYDTTYRFYNVKLDPNEASPLKKLTPQEQSIKDSFMQVLSTMHN